jgi:hypothetical protein
LQQLDGSRRIAALDFSPCPDDRQENGIDESVEWEEMGYFIRDCVGSRCVTRRGQRRRTKDHSGPVATYRQRGRRSVSCLRSISHQGFNPRMNGDDPGRNLFQLSPARQIGCLAVVFPGGT